MTGGTCRRVAHRAERADESLIGRKTHPARPTVTRPSPRKVETGSSLGALLDPPLQRVKLSALDRKFGDVFLRRAYAAIATAARAASRSRSLRRSFVRSSRVYFHSKGLATCS